MNASVSTWQIITIACIVALIIWPWFKIFAKAGFSGWMALLMLIPLVNLIMLFYLAFAEWPALWERAQR
jgi:hypothetical protein